MRSASRFVTLSLGIIAVLFVVNGSASAQAPAPRSAGASAPTAASTTGPLVILPLRTTIEAGPDKQVEPLFTDASRKVVQITLRSGATLAAHKAPVPITIQCMAGSGTLTVAGRADALPLTPGVLVTLDANIEHAVVGTPAVSVLVTQFLGHQH